MKTKIKIIIAIPLLFLLAATIVWQYATTPRSYDPPLPSQWMSETPRGILKSNGVVPISDRFRSLHSDVRNSDELLGAASPMLELDWIAEPDMFIPDGPAMDGQNNIYFSPVSPREHLMLVSIDGETGKRRWVIESDLEISPAGSGGPLILNDPERAGEEIVYIGHSSRAVAVRTAGEIIWDRRTGLPKPRKGEPGIWHNYGLNYHPQTDSLIGVFMMGHMYALDRRTGKQLLRKPWILPGSLPVSLTDELPPKAIIEKTDVLMEKVFGPTPDGAGRFSRVVDILMGGGAKVANFFAIDQESGRIFIAGTAPDELDGKKDNRSEFGALYALELVPDGDDFFRFDIVARADIKGGTASSPSLSADGKRVYVADMYGDVIALDRNLNEIWRITLPKQELVIASITVASDSRELYASTQFNIFKMEDKGESGKLIWKSKLDMYPEFPWQANINALTATITANGLAVNPGLGIKVGKSMALLKVGQGMIDRETGKLKYYKESGEESVATVSFGGNGTAYIGHSPIRRAAFAAILPFLTEPVVGGVGKYKPVRYDIFAEHAVCAAARNTQRAQIALTEHPNAAKHELKIVSHLLLQAIDAFKKDADTGGEKDWRSDIKALTNLNQTLNTNSIENTLEALNGQCRRLISELHE